jgi:hypothetical protein
MASTSRFGQYTPIFEYKDAMASAPLTTTM